MKYAFASALAALAIAGAAIAQPTTPVPPSAAAPAAPVAPSPPSACPAYPTAPATPPGASIRNQRELDAGTLVVNGFLAQFKVVHDCRIAEIQAIKAQADARVDEAKAAQDAALAYRASWQATTEAIAARGAQKKR